MPLNSNKANLERLFIQTPELPSDHWAISGSHTVGLSEGIKCSALVTGLPNIRAYFVESVSVLGRILRIASLERSGRSITSKDIDNTTGLWLGRKDFGKLEDIERLERMAGSISRGLLMLLNALPSHPPENKFPQAPSLAKNGKRVYLSTNLTTQLYIEMWRLSLSKRVNSAKRHLVIMQDLPASNNFEPSVLFDPLLVV